MSDYHDVYQCEKCGFRAEFSDAHAATHLDIEADAYYIECPFCKGRMLYSHTTRSNGQ